MSGGANFERDFRVILGIRFFTGQPDEAVQLGLRGGLVVAPAAPLLSMLARDAATREALLASNLALTDSGLMVLLWNLLKFDHTRRVSGYEYLMLLLQEPELRKPGALFWIMPDRTAQEMAASWLVRAGFTVDEADFYLAPHYGSGPISDPALLGLLNARGSAHIVIAIGGGVQERLGYYLKKNLAYFPGIHCTGAAIGFLSGNQVHIPKWADRWMLGWLFRCISAPRKFIPRYWRALELVPLMCKYRERLPG
ncbi:MAG TPA: WecB/TagA/CpsF family glycosyltransferase [Candidatus Methylacidiphilales bacterium]|nr:WecB/TagA/CpsF family glycosyltransferase [Candidatus Methylacidiphilales bacterium]